MKRGSCSILAGVAVGIALACGSPAAGAASAAVDQATRLGDADPLAALAILQQAHEAGDREAAEVLAHVLFFGPEPRQNRNRACAIAQQLAKEQLAHGWSLLASCQLAGTLAAADRFEAARASARRAVALGASSGGTVLFTAYTVDPRWGPRAADGPIDPVQRALQAEAWTGLSFALGGRDAMAAAFAIPALHDVAAPGNIDRLITAAGQSTSVAQRHAALVATARHFKALGGTHASLKSAPAAARAANAAAKVGALRDAGTPCEAFDLSDIDPGPGPDGAVYLPVAVGPLVNAYLIEGQWQERWTFSGCGLEVPVLLSFKADGSGGASFEATALPRSVVLKPK